MVNRHFALNILHPAFCTGKVFPRILLLIIAVFASVSIETMAQIRSSNAADASKATSSERGSDDSPANQSMMEMRQRWRVDAEEKEHQELLDRSDKAARLSNELSKSSTDNKAFSNSDATKIAELEKLIKKIRKNLGGADDKDVTADAQPTTITAAMTKLSEISSLLNDELKKASRHEISADSIEKSNEMLDLIFLIRSFSNSK